MNALAHAPANAINKAKASSAAHGEVVDATNAVVNAEPAVTPAATAPIRATRPAPQTASTELAPGVSATSQVDAQPEASAAFRTFVTNIRVSGVVGGASPKALINGRLVRAGEVVEPNLGVTFDGVKGNQLIFKDRSGATAQRRY